MFLNVSLGGDGFDLGFDLLGSHNAAEHFCPEIEHSAVPVVRRAAAVVVGADTVGDGNDIVVFVVRLADGAVHAPVCHGAADDKRADALLFQPCVKLRVGEAGVGVLQKHGVPLNRRERRIDLALGGAGLEFELAVFSEKAALLVAEPVMIVVKIRVLREDGHKHGDTLLVAELFQTGDSGKLLSGLGGEERAVGLREARLHVNNQKGGLLRADRKRGVPLPVSFHDAFPPLSFGLQK